VPLATATPTAQVSSARMTKVTEGKPADATIIAIVDNIEKDGQYVYQKLDEKLPEKPARKDKKKK
jgi:hypothetical protein